MPLLFHGWAYDSQYPQSAADDSLASVAAITGTIKAAATSSTVGLIVTGDDATVLPISRQARVPAGGIYEMAGVTINAATAWLATTAYSVGDYRQNGATANLYVVVIAGTSAGSGGPSGEGTAIVDGSVTWRWVGLGEGYNTVDATATVTGPTIAQAYQVTEIVTAVSGWKGVNNLADEVVLAFEGVDLF